MAQKQVGSASVSISKLIDGVNQYIFIRYSANENGNPMTETSQADTKYMGIYTSTKNIASTDYRDYSWALIKGNTGDSPVSGVLTDEFIAINTDSAGLNGDFSKTTTSIMLFEGLLENTKDWNIQVNTTTGVNGTYDSTSATYKVTSLTVDSGTITFTAKKGETTIVKKATVQKVRAGQDGDDGKGIKITTIRYQKSTSGITAPTGTWLETIPTVEANQYLWTRTVITYTDDTTSTSYSVGKMGATGGTGNDGIGISSTTIEYQSSTSGTDIPQGSWSLNIPSVSANEYLWTRTTFKYTDATSKFAYSVGKMGATGEDGKDSTSYWLVLGSQVLSVPRGATELVPKNFSIVPMRQTGSGNAEPFTGRIIVDETTDGITWSNKYSGDANAYTYTPTGITVQSIRVQLKLNSSATNLLDQKSVNIVRDGQNGAPGQDGSSSHTWVRYSKNVDGNPMTTIPNNDTRYIGIAITSSNIPPTSYSAYTWARMKGDGGLKTRLYTETGANVDQDAAEIFVETQSDGDIVTPENITWYMAKESSNKFSAIGSNKTNNLVRNSSDEWSNPITNFTGIQNYCPTISPVENENLKSGDIMNVYIEVKYDNIVSVSGQTAAFWLQGSGNKTVWAPGFPSGAGARLNNVSGSGSVIFKYQATMSQSQLDNDYWNTQLRCDYIQSGSIQWRKYKVEKSLSGSGGDYTPWTPRLGKTNNIFTGDFNLLSRTFESQNIDVNTTTYTAFDPYITDGKKTLGEMGFKVGDRITISAKWEVSKNDDLDLVYGTFQMEGFQIGAGFAGAFGGKTTLSSTNTSGTVVSSKAITEDNLKANGIRFRIDASVLNFKVDEVKIEAGDIANKWTPSKEDNRGIFIRENSIYVSPSVFLEENSITFRADTDYQSMRASDQITITNKSFDAMRPLILRQPVAPQNPYPGLLWMDTSSVDNYIYRWGRTPRQEPNGVKYTHYAYANGLEDWEDFTIFYPNINLWITKNSVPGYVTTTGAIYSPDAFNRVSDFIEVLPNTNYFYQTKITITKEDKLQYWDGWCFYDESKNLIGSRVSKSGPTLELGAETTSEQLITTPSNAKYIRIGSRYLEDGVAKFEKNNVKTPYLPSPVDDKDHAYMNFIGSYVDKIEADSTDPNMYHWTTLSDKETHIDDSGDKGVESEDFITVYDWGWIILTEEEKSGIPWLNNEDGSTIIDWIYQITQNTSDSSIINKVVGSEQMKDVYASSDDLNELVGSNQELAEKMEEYNKLMQDYANQINSIYTNMTEMQQTMDKFLFNIESAGGVNIIKNSTGFQYDDALGTFYQWNFQDKQGTARQEMGNQDLNDLGFVSGFRLNGYKVSLNQDLDLPLADIEYTLSAYLSIIGNTPGASRVVIKIVDRENNTEYGRFSSEGADITEMSKFSVTFTPPTNKVRVRIILWTDSTNTSVSASALIAGLMLNIGPFPLSWQAHHEEVYSTNVRMDGSGLKVFNSEYDGYNVMTPREFAGYYKEGEQYEKVFTLNKDTTEVKKLQAEERFMMRPIQIVAIDSETTPGWAFVGYDNENTATWNPNMLYNITIPQIDSARKYWPRLRGQSYDPWAYGVMSKPENKVFRLSSDGSGEVTYRFGHNSADNISPYINGTTYTLSLDLRANLLEGNTLRFRCESRVTSWSDLAPTTNLPDISSTEFKRYSVSITVPLDAVRFYIGIQIYKPDGTFSSIPAGNWVDFRAPKIEVGPNMTL